MNVLSDSESSDSDTGRRFKTEATRAREDYSIKKRNESSSATKSRKDYRRYSKSRSRTRSHSRSRDRNIRKRSRSRERSHRKHDKFENTEKSSSKRRDSREHRHSEKSTRDKDRDKDKDRSSHHSSTSKSNDKQRNSSSHKKSHSKSSTDELNNLKQKSQSTERTTESEDRSKRHKKLNEKVREEQSIKLSNESENRRSSDKQYDKSDSSHKQSHENSRSNERNGNKEIDTQNDESLVCGPSLPPHMLKSDKKSEEVECKPAEKKYGPSLPSDFAASSKYEAPNTYDDVTKYDSSMVDVSDNEDDDLIGPVLDHISSKSEAHLELEKRALELKLAKLNEREGKDVSTIRGREEWMIELPELRKVADLGLTARQFRTKERDEIKDRSSWTETPRDKEEKSKRKISPHDDVVKIRHQKTERIHRERRDAEQEEAARKHKKKHKRDESLLEMHQKKMKKKAQKDSSAPVERRPFSRDTDLQVNRFDEAQKKSVIKKAQLLDTRFGSGQSKYL